MNALVILFLIIPGILGSLEHLSFRFRREPADDELEGSAIGPLGPTHVDEEPETPDSGGGGSSPIIDPPIESPETKEITSPPETLEKKEQVPEPAPKEPEPSEPAVQEGEGLAPVQTGETPQTPQIPRVEETPVTVPQPPPEPAAVEETSVPVPQPPPEPKAVEETPVPVPQPPPVPEVVEEAPVLIPSEVKPETPQSEPQVETPVVPEQQTPAEPNPPVPVPETIEEKSDPILENPSAQEPKEEVLVPVPVPGTIPTSDINEKTAEEPLVSVPQTETKAEEPTSVGDPSTAKESNVETPQLEPNQNELVPLTTVPTSDIPPPVFPILPRPSLPSGPRRVSGGRLRTNQNGDETDFDLEGDPSSPVSNDTLILPEQINTPELTNTSGVDNGTSRQRSPGRSSDGSVTSSDLESNDGGFWSILPVDELSLLIFILLCLILIVILLVCCFILQHMKSWVIVRVDDSTARHNTYENVCPLQSNIEDQSTVKYTIEPDVKGTGIVELSSFSKSSPKSYSLEQETKKAEIHRSTAEVILTGSPVDPPPRDIKPAEIRINSTNLFVPPATNRPTSDPWIRNVLKSIEIEDAEQEPPVEPKSISTFGPTNGFRQKYVIPNTTSKTTISEPVATSGLKLPEPLRNQSGSMRSVDDLSGDDELDDYLDNSNFPV